MFKKANENWKTIVGIAVLHLIVTCILFNIYLLINYTIGVSGSPKLSEYLWNHNFRSFDLLLVIFLSILAEIAYNISFSPKSSLQKFLLILIICFSGIGFLFLIVNKQINPINPIHLLLELLVLSIGYGIFYSLLRGYFEKKYFLIKKDLINSNKSLNQLKNQTNPHFFFNTLNSLLASALKENANMTAEGIILFSDLMRVSLSENMANYISLEKELRFINNYINLQKLRIPENSNIIICMPTQIFNDYRIGSMLITPFIENAFKYGISADNENEIQIRMEISESDTLHFYISNINYSSNTKSGDGKGIALIKERLELLYPNNYKLEINNSPNQFEVNLFIGLN